MSSPPIPPRIRIQNVAPLVDCGRYPSKASSGETVEVRADIVRDGHEVLRAAVRHRAPDGEERVVAMVPTGYPERWRAELVLQALGRHELALEAWVDRFAGWRDELERKVAAGQPDLAGELAEGRALLGSALGGLIGAPRTAVRDAVAALGDALPQGDQVALVRDPALRAALEASRDRAELVRHEPPLAVDVDRERACFGAWYELFPRSFGGFRGVQAVLPRLAELGFDVVYLPPVHPIGLTHRKGPNNAPEAGPGDVGSPWAIGAAGGGHEAVHPDLGTVADFERLTAAAAEQGLEIALDFAIQCSPDHPWIARHPEWFHRRPDGSLKYAENPPKRYQDIYNLDLACADWERLWAALRDVVELWVARGVSIFRVDNPHTKPIAFWEWLIRDVRSRHPETVFLSEAFTTPVRMVTLAKAGFSQSYTYFTWKNTRAELAEYMTDLTSEDVAGVLRPNLFTNTPDILSAYLQEGGRAAFEARLVLAATLSPSYGIYSGFERCERVPVRPGSEEYLDSEKYQVRERDLDGPLLPLAARLNAIRRERGALQRLRPLRLLETRDEALFAYARGEGREAVVCCVCLDPRSPREGVVEIPADLGLPPAFGVQDLLTGERWAWQHGANYVRLDPSERVAHVLGVQP